MSVMCECKSEKYATERRSWPHFIYFRISLGSKAIYVSRSTYAQSHYPLEGGGAVETSDDTKHGDLNVHRFHRVRERTAVSA